jgi:peptide/nickel transport system permease protein
VVETVFSWPGLGRLLVRAVAASDYPLAQGAFLMIAVVMVFMNFVADLLYGVLDPRVGSDG